MSIASALLAGNEAEPALAEQALRLALERTAENRANGVLLFLTQDFSRKAQQAVTAVARAARCTQVAGGIAAGVFTDRDWVLDRPAAAVMVFAGDVSLGHVEAGEPTGDPILSYAGSTFPNGWSGAAMRRFGGSFAGRAGQADRVAWQQSYVQEQCSLLVLGAQVDVSVSLGWRLLGVAQPVESSQAHTLLRVGGKSAFDSLMCAVAGARDGNPPPGAADISRLFCAMLVEQGAGDAGRKQRAFADGGYHPVAIIGGSQDGSLTLAERIAPGQLVVWAIRLPQAAEDDMCLSVARLAVAAPDPAGGLVFSCIGRGPYFYDGEDHDLDRLRDRYPGLPLLGTYGTGQIAANPAGGNRLLQNAVVTALISTPDRKADVQSKP